MPIPFILGAIAVGAGLVGAKKAIDASDKNSQARQIAKSAQKLVEDMQFETENAREQTQYSIEQLGHAKMNLLKSGMKRFIKAYSQINYIELGHSKGMEELGNLQIPTDTLKQMKDAGDLANTLSSTTKGAATGGLVALGAYGLAANVGMASTGAAISGLSGVAATNATLAWLGGGSLAAGGLGMTGGMVVLGGLVAGPALAAMGIFANSKAEENLANAKSNMAEAKRIAEELNGVIFQCHAISDRADMFTELLRQRLSPMFYPLVARLEKIVRNKTDYREYTAEEQQCVAMTTALALALKKVVDTPILTKDGNVTKHSLKVYRSIEASMKRFPKR